MPLRLQPQQASLQDESEHDQQEHRQQRRNDHRHRQRLSAAIVQRHQPVERALQDVDRGVLVDHLGAPGAAHVGSDQLALHRRGGEPLVPQADREIGQPGKIAGKGAGRLRARSFAGVHVDGQAEHEADGVALGGDRDQPRRVGL